MASARELLAWIDAFRPTSADGDWRILDGYVEALPVELLRAEDVPVLLRVFERFPRHDGHGVFWPILHAIEAIPGHATLVLAHVQRTPTELGITMLGRMIRAGTTHVDGVPLAPLVEALAPRAPIVDYTIDPAQLARPGTAYPRPVDEAPVAHAAPPHASRASGEILDAIARFEPALADDIDWAPLRALLAELEATRAPIAATIDTLLATLDRFRTYPAFAAFWPIVQQIEGAPAFADALVASLLRAPSEAGVTLVLRALANGITHAGGVELAPFAAARLPPAPHTHA